MDRTPQAKRWDRLTPEARRKAERNSERKAFGDATALSEALQQALQKLAPNDDNPARIRRQQYRDTR